MNLELSLKQTLKLSPQMLQSMEILQMSTLELNGYIQELVQENPAAELAEPPDPGDESEELWRRLQSLADLDHQNRQYVTADRDELDPLARVGTDGGLADTLLLHLTRQLERRHASTIVLRGAQFLAASLDEDGYLRDDVADLAQAAGLPASILEEGLSLLQTLDPPGVGARDLSQCLALQLQRQGESGTALAIVQRHLEHLARKQYHAIAQDLGVSQEAVREAERQIQALDPRPGSAFAGREEPNYLIHPAGLRPGHRPAAGGLFPLRRRPSGSPAPERRGPGTGRPRVHRQPGHPGKVSPVRPGGLPPQLFLLTGGGFRRGGDLRPPDQEPAQGAGGGGGQGPPPVRPEAVPAAGGRGGHHLPPHGGQIPGRAGHLQRQRPTGPSQGIGDHMKAYRAICFDFDYTLGDSTDSIVAGFQYGFARLGQPVPDRETVRGTIGYLLEDAYELLTGDGDPDHKAQFRAYFLEVAKPRQREETTLFPGAAELLRGLHSRGVRLGIVSTKTGETIEYIMDRYGLKDTLEFVIGSYDVTRHKPHPEGILKALDRMGVSKEDFLYCGDTVLDAEAAQRAGVDFAAVLNGTTPAEDFAPWPCVHIAPDLPDLARALEQ